MPALRSPPILLLASLLLLSADFAAGSGGRRVALRVAPGLSPGPELERVAGWARRQGILLEIGPESAPVPPGAEAVFLSLLPASSSYRRRLERFPVRLERNGFVFDGRAYRHPNDAMALADPGAAGVSFVFGNGARAVLRLSARAIFRWEEQSADYRVVSGELSKQGRFGRAGASLSIDRASDRDEIASREEFLRSLRSEERDGVRWLFRESERGAAALWRPVLAGFLGKGRLAAPLSVRLFPDAETKARGTGSSRPADLAREGRGLRVDLDVSSPRQPDLVTPVLAAAALAAEEPRLAERPMLLLALGARACGRWWGREVAGFSAFLARAGAEPSVEEVLRDGGEVSPVLAVGAAAAWLEAGGRLEGERALRKKLLEPDGALAAALHRWRERAHRENPAPPPRRTAPAGFLRGISYAMANELSGGYASPRSRATLERLARLSANSISVMPFAFSPEAARPEIDFVHRSARGETDEGTVRAVSDARAVGLSALVKPQIWLPGRVFVGDVAMGSEQDWKAWFAAYRRFIVHHAIVAEASGAALFCVGTELTRTEARDRDWRETIAAVRLATGAPLLYAANWASDAEKVPFWDALDLIGVDFYDPLSKDPSASDADLEAGARRAAEPVARLSRRFGRPAVFAEVGYPPVSASWVSPHDEDSGRPRAPEDAARAIAAVFRALGGEPWWKGAFWWKAFSDGRDARPGETGFNVLGTPSEKAIAAGFAREAAQGRARR
ncbi:MAG: glycoside hydrolase family 113 [Acidobacteriota bacterium]